MTEGATIHGTCVAIDGRGVLLRGPSGSGKSDLALRLFDLDATLVSDDYVRVQEEGGILVARPPESIKGKLEVRGVGIVEVPHQGAAPLCLVVDLTAPDQIVRMPEMETVVIAPETGIKVRRIQVAPFEASAPAKIRLALRMISAGARRED